MPQRTCRGETVRSVRPGFKLRPSRQSYPARHYRRGLRTWRSKPGLPPLRFRAFVPRQSDSARHDLTAAAPGATTLADTARRSASPAVLREAVATEWPTSGANASWTPVSAASCRFLARMIIVVSGTCLADSSRLDLHDASVTGETMQNYIGYTGLMIVGSLLTTFGALLVLRPRAFLRVYDFLNPGLRWYKSTEWRQHLHEPEYDSFWEHSSFLVGWGSWLWLSRR